VKAKAKVGVGKTYVASSGGESGSGTEWGLFVSSCEG